MLTNSKVKLIKSLTDKKNRSAEGLFMVEGEKMINEALQSRAEIAELFTTDESFVAPKGIAVTIISDKDLSRISSLKTPNKCLATIKIPTNNLPAKLEGLTLAIDGVNDPGNLGTIIRTAHWFGVHHIVLSENSVDVYNPKVLQSTMGSIFKVQVHYVHLVDFIDSYKANTNYTVIGAVLKGEQLYSNKLPKNALLVMGSESHGISNDVSELLTHKLTIPQGGGDSSPESLNLAISTAIILAEYCRLNG